MANTRKDLVKIYYDLKEIGRILSISYDDISHVFDDYLNDKKISEYMRFFDSAIIKERIRNKKIRPSATIPGLLDDIKYMIEGVHILSESIKKEISNNLL